MAAREFQSVETQYSGTHFRSRLEARWAVFFDALGIKWNYELCMYELQDGTDYLPDFSLEDDNFKLEFEVKGQWPDEREVSRCRMLALYCFDTCIFHGLPAQHDGALFIGRPHYSSWPGFAGDMYSVSIFECLPRSRIEIESAAEKAASIFLPAARRKSKSEWYAEWNQKRDIMHGAWG